MMGGRHRASPPRHSAKPQRWARIAVVAVVIVSLGGAWWVSDRAHREMTAVQESPPVESTAPPPTPVHDPSAEQRGKIVESAEVYAGRRVPYIDGGKDPRKGLDASGLVWQVLKDSGLKVPYRTVAGLKTWTKRIEFGDLHPGDLVFYARHVGIFVGDGQVIDTSMISGAAVEHEMWLDPYPTFGRVPDP